MGLVRGQVAACWPGPELVLASWARVLGKVGPAPLREGGEARSVPAQNKEAAKGSWNGEADLN